MFALFTAETDCQSGKKISSSKIDDLPVFFFPGLSAYPELFHFITTREGGCSKIPFQTFNLALHVGDKREDVLQNRSRLARSLHLSPQKIITSNQVHGTQISRVAQDIKGNATENHFQSAGECDGLITDQRDLCLLVFIADCVPVFLFDRRKKVIAVIHAGWKGTIGKITQNAVQQMKSAWGCKPQDILCAIGPSIGPCCYQVGPEVISRVKKAFPAGERPIHSITSDGKGYFNLWQANKIQLLHCQIPDDNIVVADLCTYCHPDIFFSNRREGRATGRFAAGILLRSYQAACGLFIRKILPVDFDHTDICRENNEHFRKIFWIRTVP